MADMPDLQASWAFLENSELISSAAEVDAAIDRLAVEIEKQFKDRYPLVLVVMGGAVVLAGQLLPKLRMPLDLDYIHATRYGAATSGCGMDAKGFWRNLPEIRAMRES